MKDLAGFDLVLELSANALWQLIEAGQPASGFRLIEGASFCMPLPTLGSSLNARASFLIPTGGVNLKFTPHTGSGRLAVTMTGGWISLQDQAINNLDGVLVFDFQVQTSQLAAGLRGAAQIGFLEIRPIKVVWTFTVATRTRLDGMLGRIPLPPGVASPTTSDLENALNGALSLLEDRVRTFPANPGVRTENGIRIVEGFLLMSGTDGSFADPTYSSRDHSVMRFTTLSALATTDHTFAMALTLFAQQKPKTTPATDLPPGTDFVVRVAAEAFREFNFCPQVRESLHTINDKIQGTSTFFDELHDKAITPGCCGTAEELVILRENVEIFGNLDVLLTHACVALDEGRLIVSVGARVAEFCVKASISVKQDFTIALQSDSSLLVARTGPARPESSVHVNWICAAAAFIVSPAGTRLLVGLLETAIFPALSLALDMGAIYGASQIDPAIARIPVPLGKLTQASVHREGLLLAGLVPPIPHDPTPLLRIKVRNDVATFPATKIDHGVYHFPGNPRIDCPAGDFSWEEFAQAEEIAFDLVADGLCSPLTVGITLKTTSDSVQIQPGTGTVQLKASVFLPQPIPLGSHYGGQVVNVDYDISNSVIRLRCRPGEGSFGFLMHVTLTNPRGELAEVVEPVGLRGRFVTFEPAYAERLRECMIKSRLAIDKFRTIPQEVPRGGDPGRDWLIGYIDAINQLPPGDTVIWTTHSRLAYGKSFERAEAEVKLGRRLGVGKIKNS